MKVLLLSDPSSPHTVRWANALFLRGIDVRLFGLSDFNKDEYNPEIKIDTLKTPESIKSKTGGSFTKLVYLIAYPKLKKIIKEFNPDIIHAHYAASYGVFGALTGFHPSILSVWGIDILTFTKVSRFHKGMVKFALKRYDKILATSSYLKNETQKILNTEVIITPFGIDINKFKKNENEVKNMTVIIGVIKSLEGKYGIDLLIDLFAKLRKEFQNIKLMIIGGGSLERKFRAQARNLQIEDDVEFTGRVSSSQIVKFHNKLDIAVYLSSVESFGVSILESSACEVPVVASNIGGLREVVVNNKTGFLVNRNDKEKTYNCLKELIQSPELRSTLGKNGREFVRENYNWNSSLDNMIKIYNSVAALRDNVS